MCKHFLYFSYNIWPITEIRKLYFREFKDIGYTWGVEVTGGGGGGGGYRSCGQAISKKIILGTGTAQ